MRSPDERFADSYLVAENGCWIWKANFGKRRYGSFYANGKRMQAHHYAWSAFIGPIPDGLYVLHKCDTPKCVNPEHLFLGTQIDNIRDMVNKGRARNLHMKKTVCKRGHEFSHRNSRVRVCGECKRQAAARYYKRLREENAKVNHRRNEQ